MSMPQLRWYPHLPRNGQEVEASRLATQYGFLLHLMKQVDVSMEPDFARRQAVAQNRYIEAQAVLYGHWPTIEGFVPYKCYDDCDKYTRDVQAVLRTKQRLTQAMEAVAAKKRSSADS